jgi:type IV pilus assembly protein PilV
MNVHATNHMNQLNKTNNSGFTILEILMAMAIISIGLLGLAAVQSSALLGNTKAQKQSMAVILAENKIEGFINNNWNTTPPLQTHIEEGGTTLSATGIYTRITDINLNTCSDGTVCTGGNLQCCGIAFVRVQVIWPGRTANPVDIRTTIVQK